MGRYKLLKVEVAHISGIFLDKRLAALNIVAHQHAHYVFGFCRFFNIDLQQGACGRVHGGAAQFLPIHLAETFQPLELFFMVGIGS